MTRFEYRLNGKRSSIALLDIGTNKVVCFIAEPDQEGEYHITGIGHQLAKGIKSGMIVDTGEAETSILSAVHAAEQMAHQTVENVVVNISGSHLQSHAVSVELKIGGGMVGNHHVTEVMREGCAAIRKPERSIVHCFASHYRLDDAGGIRDPRNMIGRTLMANLHMITADNTRIANLTSCVARCHLNVAEYVASAHASGLGCLEPDEMSLGVLLLDIGGRETNIAIFAGGVNIYSETIPLGSFHATCDIAKGLSTSLATAERIKSLQGSAIVAPQDGQVMIEVQQIGDNQDTDEAHMVPRAMLINIIRPRFEEVLEIVRQRLEACGFEKYAGRHVVMTGGGSQLVGLRELAAQILGKQVRIGRPKLVHGLADSVSGPAFSGVVGMMKYITERPMEDILFDTRRLSNSFTWKPERLFGWIKENF